MRTASMVAMVMAMALAGCPDPAKPDKGVDLSTLASVVESHADGAFFSTWNDGPDDVWIVGGGWERPSALHFDGTAWTTHDTGLEHQLWWVHGFSGGPIFVVGAGGTIGKYDGETWTALDAGAPNTVFYGVWGPTPDDVWAVSGQWHSNPDAEVQSGIVARYDGAAWTQVTIPALEARAQPDGDLFKVWGASADAIFIVGAGGLALHYDGSEWRSEDTGVPDTLFTVAGRSATDVWAIGGLGNTRLIRWNGAAWSQVGVPEYTPGQAPGLWTAPGHPVYIAGMNGYTAKLTDDGAWQEGEIVHFGSYHGIRGDGTRIWAVGGDIQSTTPTRGDIAVAGGSVPAP